LDDSAKKVILIADDVPENIEVLGKILAENYQVKIATNGFEALEIARTPNAPPDLILLDVMMPFLDGYEVCRALKKDPATSDIPIIFLTALSNQGDEYAGLELGAIDFLTKPFIPHAIELRVQNHLELHHTRQKLQKAVADLQDVRKREIQIATEIQHSLLLGRPPQNIAGVAIETFTQPSLGVDGDFFDFFQVNPVTFDILFGDVMGKGIPAGLIGAATKSHFPRALARLLIASPEHTLPSPEAIVNEVQAEMAGPLAQVGRFVSLHYARFDLKERVLDLVTCGHTPLLHRRGSDNAWVEWYSPSTPLGIALREEEPYRQQRIVFEAGDLFLFASDGAGDARNPDGDFFGLKRLQDSVGRQLATSHQEMLRALHRDLVAFTQSTSFADDLTLIAIRV
jgi:serine phosphatase RsbU (regulator of sigma subunit)